MKTLSESKNELKALIPDGIDIAIKGIKAALAEGTDKYNDLLLIEGRYHDASRQLLQGVVGDESAQVQFNKIRKDLLDFIDDLQEIHLLSAEKTGVDGKPDIYNGEVLYRIPKQMQKEEETKCLVRLAFDRTIITQDLELEKGDVIKDLRISEVMGVELLDMSGKAFQIRTLHDTVQFVEKDLYTEWLFFVKPLLEGFQELILKISIIEIKDGIERKRNIVLEEKVEIISSVPEKSGVTEAFAKAGIALAVAKNQEGGIAEQPQPKPKSVYPNAPSPSPSPAPTRPGTSFRKIASGLSAMIVLLIASWAMWNNLSPNKTDITPTDSETVAKIEQEKWNKIKNNPNQLDIRDFLKNHPDSELSQQAKNALDSLDNQAWNSALASNDLEKIKEYRNQFPDGRYVETAASMILEIESAIAEKAVPVPLKDTPVPANPGRENGGKKNKKPTGNTGTTTTSSGESPLPPNTKEKEIPTDPNEPIPMRSTSRLPIYPGCKNDDQQKERACTDSNIGKYIKKNLQYPEEAKRQKIEGTVTVEFIVEKDGKISGVQYKNDIGGGCAKEAVRLVQRLPKFDPGLNRLGQPARIRYVLPIKFDLR